MSLRFRGVAAGVLCVIAAGAAEAQVREAPAGARVVSAVRIPDGELVRLDGVLDEAVWRTAVPAEGFVQREPDNGAPATQPTEVRVLYDATRIIFGATLQDDEPERILGNQMQRDQSFSADDRFIVTVDTFLDGRSGYIFETNPLGALADGLLSASTNSNDESRQDVGAAVNRSWDGIWMARVRRGPDGWVAEIEVPFRTLNFDPGLTTWGVNFQRTVRRKAEESVWTGYQRNEGVGNMSNAGRLQGLIGISQGVGLDVKPYAVGNLTSEPGRGRRRARHDRRRRRRPVLQPDAGAARQPQHQHRLCRNRGRPAAGQPDAVSAVLCREARLLSPGRHVFRLRPGDRRSGHAVLQQTHRAGRARGPAADSVRRQADRSGGRVRHRRPPGAQR